MYIVLCEPYFSKFMYLRLCFVCLLQTAEERHQPGSGVLQSHIQSWPPWGMASGISCVCGCWRGGRRGRGPVGMRKRRPNMGLTSPAGPAGEWKAITKGPIPQLITVCYLPELTSKKNWNYREGKGAFAKPEGEQVVWRFENNTPACFLHAITLFLPLIGRNFDKGPIYT